MTPCLNWKELEVFISTLGQEIEGLFVDRIIVPERARFPDKYLKGEWAIRFTGRKNEGILLVSIRPRHPYLAWKLGKGPAASLKATRSPFDQNISKNLKGAKLLKCQTLHQERVVIFWFSEEGSSQTKLGLVLVLIPASPEAFLVTAPLRENEAAITSKAADGSVVPGTWKILTRSRTVRDEAKQLEVYQLPNGFSAPQNPIIREEYFSTPTSFFPIIEKELLTEAFSLRCQNAEKALRLLLKQALERLRHSETSMKEARREENWQKQGDLLKSVMGNPPEIISGHRLIMDYETELEVKVPADPKLDLTQQVEKFYHNARRKQRRIEEAESRMNRFREVSEKLSKAIEEKPAALDWPALEKLERFAGGAINVTATTTEGKPGKKNSGVVWMGKSFIHARGNDMWMHVRGRPGAHAVIPLPQSKSAPLETLLDAALLTVYYSKGENWGKTEVDYTFKKYVKRIKDSSEASYTHNKTLLIEPDAARLKRLLDQNI
jgi:predicted ribosome quality control (RQC) complex YloA/Tae2 family protein